ncbi:hypothetical protein ACEWY4_018583 [Coilia grayii]|uniref:KASH5-like coiled-coil domain-containing protein n=1 Tax=Coilia grayii TaxID=363190 RepID=A0ABD1JGP7_9TELE
MLRRTVSQPIGLDRVEQHGGFNTSMQDLTVFARSRSSLVLDNDYTSDFFRQSTQWDSEGEGHGWQPIGRCRAMGYDEPDHDEIKVSEEYDAVYTAEEEEVWNSSDLSLGEKRVIVELLHNKKCLMRRNADLLKALDVCEDTNTYLEKENAALKSQIKSMKQSSQDAEQLMEEMDVIRGALAESEAANSSLKSCISNLEKENKALLNQLETMTNKLSSILPERESDKNKITELTQHIKALQQQLEKTRVELDVKTAEANSILRKAVKNLEGQLEFARVTAGGSFLKSGDIVLPATQNHLSLAEELGLLPGLPESDEEVDELNEAVKVEEEIHFAFQESDEEVDELNEAVKVEEEIHIAFQESDEEVDEVEDATKEATRHLDEKDVFRSLDEGDVNKHHQASFDVEQIGVCATAVGDAPPYQSVDWKGVACRSFARGVLAASVFCLGVGLPLSVISAAVPPQHSRSGMGCTEFLWNTVSQTLEQYCSIHHPGRPPF